MAPSKSKKATKSKREEPKENRVAVEAYERYRAQFAKEEPATRQPYTAKKTKEIVAAFLTYLSLGHLPGVAAQKAGLGRTTVFEWKAADPEFAAAWDEAVQMGDDLLEEEVRRRAVEGCDRPVFQQGECVGFVREYSDSLAAMMLQGRRKAYRRDKDDNTTGVTIVIKGGLPEKE